MAEPTPPEADPRSGTGGGLIAFLNWAIRKNEIPENSAVALRTGARRVLETDDGLMEQSVRDMDVEDVARRFRNKQRGGEFKDASIEDYVRRFKQTVDMYVKWLDGDSGWRPPVRRPASRPKGSSDNGGQAKPTRTNAMPPAQTSAGTTIIVPTAPVGTSSVEMVVYPYPVRPGVMAQVQLPVDLTAKEAERVAKFVAALAFDERLAITAGPEAE